MRKWKTSAIVTLCVATILIAAPLYFFRPFSPLNQPLLIAEITLPQGTRAYLTQTYRGFPDFYDVHFYAHSQNRGWRQYYVEHEEFFWASGALRADPRRKILSVYRGARPMAHFNWNSNSYRLERDKPEEASPNNRMIDRLSQPPSFAPR